MREPRAAGERPPRRKGLKLMSSAVLALAVSGGTVLAVREPAPPSHTVEMRGMKFAPAHLTVRPGETVVWVNRDAVPHNVTRAQAWNSGTVAAGDRWSTVVRSGGAYNCTLHPGMSGHVAVE